jgi:CDP-paratose 2-epimerase
MFPAELRETMAASANSGDHILITGGAGFIGANLAAHLLAATNARVTVLDNLSRPGSDNNLAWVQSQALAGRFRFVRADVRSVPVVREAATGACEIYHLVNHCGESAGSQSEFDVHVNGTLNVLDAARRSTLRPPVMYLSTAKVYEPMPSNMLRAEGSRFVPVEPGFNGIPERAATEADSPYLCWKGLADRQFLEYGRAHEVPVISLRCDTVAGPRQFENEGHGWVAHLVYSILADKPVTVYGSGLQVRDILHVSDVVNAILAARDFRGVTAGEAYNVGGGASHTASVLEMIQWIERTCHRRASVHHAAPRAGDRAFYMADASAFSTLTGWSPRRSLQQTIRDVAAFWNAMRGQVHVPLSHSKRIHHRGLQHAA